MRKFANFGVSVKSGKEATR